MTMKILVGLLVVAAPIFGEGRWTHGPKQLIPKGINPRYAAGAPIFDHKLSEGQLSQLAAYLDGYRKPGARVVRLQIISADDNPVVQALRAGEARELPPGESVTLWGEYGRGSGNRNDLTRIRVRYAVVDDQRPAFIATTTQDGWLTIKGWVVEFDGKEASRWNSGRGSNMRGSRVSSCFLPKNPWDAQIRASSVLRHAVKYARDVLDSRALKVPLIR